MKVGASRLGIPDWTSGCYEDSSALSSRPRTPWEGGRNPRGSPLHFWGRGSGFRWFYSGTSSLLHIICVEASQESSASLLNGSCILEENGPLLSIPCPSAQAAAPAPACLETSSHLEARDLSPQLWAHFLFAPEGVMKGRELIWQRFLSCSIPRNTGEVAQGPSLSWVLSTS